MPRKKSNLNKCSRNARRLRAYRALQSQEQTAARNAAERIRMAEVRRQETPEQRNERLRKSLLRTRSARQRHKAKFRERDRVGQHTNRTLTCASLIGLAFQYAPDIDYSVHPKITFGAMDEISQYCQALKFCTETTDMPKTNAECCRDYRKKRKENKTKKTAKSATQRVREFRARRKMCNNDSNAQNSENYHDESQSVDASASAWNSAEFFSGEDIESGRPSSLETLKLNKPNKIHTKKSFIRQMNTEKLLLSTESGKIVIDPTASAAEYTLDMIVEPEQGGSWGAGGAVVKLELFEVDESESTCYQRDDDGVSYSDSLRNAEDSNNDALELDAFQILKHTYHHYKCSSCGGPVQGFRYACVQCADYYQCAECEASGAHAEHYVLRVPRVERAAELQTVLDRIRREIVQINIPVQMEKSEEEEEFLVLKTEPVELRGETDPLQCVGAGSGGGAMKQEVIDPDDSAVTASSLAGAGARQGLPTISWVPVSGPSPTGEASHTEAGAGEASGHEGVDQSPEMLWVEAGRGAVKQGAFNTDEDFLKWNKMNLVERKRIFREKMGLDKDKWKEVQEKEEEWDKKRREKRQLQLQLHRDAQHNRRQSRLSPERQNVSQLPLERMELS